MRQAVNYVKQRKGSIRAAAERFEVPKSTLSEKVRGIRTLKLGGQPVFSMEEEKKLVDGLMLMGEWGFPLMTTDLKNVIQNYLDKTGPTRAKPVFPDNRPGKGWIKGFFQRHPELSLRFSENIKRSRAGVTPEVINEYFDNLEETLAGIPPSNILNYDETNFTDNPGRVKVIVKRGCKHPERILDTSKTATSVMVTTAADGTLLPPFIVYKANFVYENWTENGPDGARYGATKSGWFDMAHYERWFKEIALPYLKKLEGKKAIIGDNLSSHLSPEVTDLCIANNIEFVLLPANSTHLTQVNDVTVFKPIKSSYKGCLSNWKSKNRGVLPKTSFPKMLKDTLDGVHNMKANIIAGFKACGIYPLNRHEVLKRLPGYDRGSRDANGTEINDSLLQALQSMRSTETQKKKRGKKVEVPPGKSHTAPGSSQEAERARRTSTTKPAARVRRISTSKRPRNRTRDDRRQVEDEETSASEDSESEEEEMEVSEPEGEEETEDCDVNDVEFEEKDFILARYKTEQDNRAKYFVGFIANLLDDGLFEVEFLRKKDSPKDIYFHYPLVPDIDNVKKCDILCKLKLKESRRGRHYFAKFPIDLKLIS